MARIRTIKPEFFTSEDIVSLTPMARLLYIALWCEADKEGRLVWKPATFKLRYLPGDNCNVTDLCAELVDKSLVLLYGDGFAYIPSFKAHQHINPRESVSQLPDPDAIDTRRARVGTRQSRVVDAQGGREGKGREGIEKGARKRSPSFDASQIELPDWMPLELWGDWCQDRAARGKRITELGARQQLVTLDEFRKQGHMPERVIRHAISSGNQGLFPPPRLNPADVARATTPASPAASAKPYLDELAAHRKAVEAERLNRKQTA